MKKVYFSTGLLFASIALIAQNDQIEFLQEKVVDNGKLIKTAIPTATKAAVIWSNDFSTPGDWTFANTSSPSQNWIVTTNAAAIPVPALSPAAFTTVGNGYALIDSDGAGSGVSQNADLTADTLIDLTAVSSVGLRFQHTYRTFEDRRTVRVSNDAGVTWTEFVITEGLNSEANQNTGNPDVLTLNISSVAANQDSVKIQFHYEGSYSWYWAIDDVAVIELDDHDLKSVDIFGGNTEIDFEYSRLPLTQTRPLGFGMIIKNVGGTTQTGVGFDYDINDGTSSVETGSIGDTSIMSTLVDTLFGNSTYTPSTLGTYTYTLTAKADSTDADINDNTMSRSIEMTNFIWALDYGTNVASINQAGAVGIDSTDIFKIGNQFFSRAEDTVWSVDVELGSSTLSVGNEFFVEVRVLDNGSWNLVSTTLAHTVTANEPGTVVNIDLQDEVIIEAGTQFIILACHYGGAYNERVSFARSGMVSQGSVRFADPSTDALSQFGGKQRAMRIRANLDRFSNNVSVKENDLSLNLAQNMPNPAKENTIVAYTLVNNSDVTLKITDINGKVIATYTENNQVKGNHVINVNTNDMAQGVYQYTLTTNNASATKSMVVVK